MPEAVLPADQLTTGDFDDAMNERAGAHVRAINACAALITIKLIESHDGSNRRGSIQRDFSEWMANKPVDAVMDADTMMCLYVHMPEFNDTDCATILTQVREGLLSRFVDIGSSKLLFSRSFMYTHTNRR